MIKNIVKPCLKWAGGKTQVLEQLNSHFPVELKTNKIKKYFEPFIGGGAVFLHIAQFYSINELFICDLNPELVLLYKTIQKDVENLIDILLEIEFEYSILDDEKRKIFFYEERSQFNSQKDQINLDCFDSKWLERTAQIIFLNKTCFNGLFRVNKKGEFNVPMGKYKNPTICDQNNLRELAKVLQRTCICYGDFSSCKEEVNEETFVYFDPPYRALNKTASFNAYSAKTFDDKEQIRLRDFFNLLNNKGAKLMLSNCDPKNENPDDNFFDEAYSQYHIKRIKAPRFINSKASKRGKINELLITNYDDFIG